MADEIKKPSRKINEIHEIQFARTEWVAKPERGTSLAEMLEPAYWASVAKKLRQWDRIEVRPTDGSWLAELVVVVVEPFAVKVHVRWAERFDKIAAIAEDTAVPAGYSIKHRGRAGWSVVRDEDTKILAQDLGSRVAAVQFLEHHLRVLAA